MTNLSGQPEEIDFETFLKVDLRFGTVKEAERVPKSSKLIRMLVSFGSFERQIVAGVGKTFEPDDLVNEQFLFVVNLAPRKLMGLESHGMMLATSDPLALLTSFTRNVLDTASDGSRVS